MDQSIRKRRFSKWTLQLPFSVPILHLVNRSFLCMKQPLTPWRHKERRDIELCLYGLRRLATCCQPQTSSRASSWPAWPQGAVRPLQAGDLQHLRPRPEQRQPPPAGRYLPPPGRRGPLHGAHVGGETGGGAGGADPGLPPRSPVQESETLRPVLVRDCWLRAEVFLCDELSSFLTPVQVQCWPAGWDQVSQSVWSPLWDRRGSCCHSNVQLWPARREAQPGEEMWGAGSLHWPHLLERNSGGKQWRIVSGK